MTYGSGNSGDYKKLKGQTIQVVDTDPVAYAGSWASSTATNSAREECGAGGTATSAIVFGGYNPGGVMGNTETWNGSAWTEVGDLNTVKKKSRWSWYTYNSFIFIRSRP